MTHKLFLATLLASLTLAFAGCSDSDKQAKETAKQTELNKPPKLLLKAAEEANRGRCRRPLNRPPRPKPKADRTSH